MQKLKVHVKNNGAGWFRVAIPSGGGYVYQKTRGINELARLLKNNAYWVANLYGKKLNKVQEQMILNIND